MSQFPPRGALLVSFGEACDRGKVREENQDSIRSASIPLGDLFIVADGIGGYQGGATASRMVVEGFHAQLASRPANYPADHALAEANNYTNASIHAAANSGDPSKQRMGSTVVLALIQDGTASGGASGEVASFGPTAWIGHVGDSRAYLIRAGQMTKITNDHSAVQALINRNLITEEEARNHPDASVLTRSLGHRPEVEIELDRVPLQAGDCLLLCSDGLWGYVADADIAGVATDPNLSVEKIAQYLLDLALSAGGHDNIGIEFIRIGSTSPNLTPTVPVSSRTGLRSTIPELNTMSFARPAQAPAASFAAAPVAPTEPPRGHSRQILIGVCLLALAVGGALGLIFRNRGNIPKPGPDNPAIKGSSTPGSGSDSEHGTHQNGEVQRQKPRITGENPTPNPLPNPAVSPAEEPANHGRTIAIVGEIELGPLHADPHEIEAHHTTIRPLKTAACVNLATAETVAYVNNPDLTERAVVEAIVKSYPKVKEHVKAPEVRKKEMTQEVKDACGSGFDAIVILAAKQPAAATPTAADPPTPRPTETQDPPAAHLNHPKPPPYER